MYKKIQYCKSYKFCGIDINAQYRKWRKDTQILYLSFVCLCNISFFTVQLLHNSYLSVRQSVCQNNCLFINISSYTDNEKQMQTCFMYRDYIINTQLKSFAINVKYCNLVVTYEHNYSCSQSFYGKDYVYMYISVMVSRKSWKNFQTYLLLYFFFF